MVIKTRQSLSCRDCSLALDEKRTMLAALVFTGSGGGREYGSSSTCHWSPFLPWDMKAKKGLRVHPYLEGVLHNHIPNCCVAMIYICHTAFH